MALKCGIQIIKSLWLIFISFQLLDTLSEEAKSVLGNKKKKTGDNSSDSNAITITLDFKRYVFDKSMAQ